MMTTNIYAQHYGEEGPTLTPNNLGLVYENAIEKNEDGKKIGRNDPCPCGSGKKYKNCHGKDK